MWISSRGGLCVAVLAVFCQSAIAETPPAAELVTRKVDESTLALIRLDLNKMTPQAWSIVSRLIANSVPDVDGWIREQLANGCRGLVDVGATHVDFSVGIPLMAEHSPILDARVMARDGGSATKIADIIRKNWSGSGYQVEAIGASVAISPAKRLSQFDSARPGLAEALGAVADGMAAIAVVPSADQRRVIRELAPDLPIEGAESALRDSLVGLAWISLSYAPGESLRLIASADSPEAAKSAQATVLRLFETAKSQTPEGSPIRLLLPRLLKVIEPVVQANQLVVALDAKQIALLETAVGPMIKEADQVAERRTAMNKMKNIAIALHNDVEAYKKKRGGSYFVDAAELDGKGQPLLSWRVHLLPFLDQDKLYKQFHLDEPWDSEHNRALISLMPDVYRIGGPKVLADGKTCVVLPIGGNTIYPGGKGMDLREVKDGLSTTILAVEADDDHAVIWTKPDDIGIDGENPAAGLGGHFGPVFLALMADGSVRAIDITTNPEHLRALFSPTAKDPSLP